MGKSAKRKMKQIDQDDEDVASDPQISSEDDIRETIMDEEEEDEFGEDGNLGEVEEEEESGRHNDAEMDELEKEYFSLRSQEQDIVKNLKRQKDDDALKGQAVKNQKVLWDKSLEFRFLLQKVFSTSNKLPQEPVKSSYCKSGEDIKKAYSELELSCKQTLKSMEELQEVILQKNPSIIQDTGPIGDIEGVKDEEWMQIHQMHCRLAPFRNSALDKWQRKTQVTSGAAAFKGKLHAFNQNISEQVASHMRDPSKIIKRMQLRHSSVDIFGKASEESESSKEEVYASNSSIKSENEDADGDPELLDDSEFYQQLLKEFLESCTLPSSENAFYALKRLQPKKRKIVDRRASKSRKIRYDEHSKIVNFMAPMPMALPAMAPKLFDNLFGMGKTQKLTPAV